MLLLEEFFDSALVISRCSNEGKTELLNLFLPALVHMVTEENICCMLQQEALRTLNSILDSVPREERKKFPLSEEMCSLTKDLAKTLLEAGDYDLQVALSEALCRLMTKKWRDDLVHHWFEDNYLAEAFKEIKDREFETDCRKFLNQLNERLGSERRVYSLPCLSAFADTIEVKKPSDEKLEKFWIDFNADTQSVTFYVHSNEGALWDSVRLSKEAISSYTLQESAGEKIVKIYMKIPVPLDKIEATKIKISFSAEFEVLSILRKVLGDEKMMINVAEEEPVHAGKQARQTETVIPEYNNSQARKDPSASESMDSLSDDQASQDDQQLTGTKMVNSGVTTFTQSLQTDTEDATQAKKSRTPSPRTKAKPSEKPLEEESMEELTPKVLLWVWILQHFSFQKDVTWGKRKRKRSSAKQKAEGRKEVYDFENSDSASHEKVAEAKGKIFGQKISSQNRSYRKHLFSESDNEHSSPSQSEKSWILDSQKHSLPKSLDYSRKRPRVRSKLKVLPVSSASSSSDYQTRKEPSRRRAQKEMPRKKSTSSSKADNSSTVILAEEMVSELQEDTLPVDVSAKGYASGEEATQTLHKAPGKPSKEEGNFTWNDSDILSSTAVTKSKFSSWKTTSLFSDTSYKPRKHFDPEEKTQTGQEMDDKVDNKVDDAFFPKAQHENFSGSGVIAAFENFTSQLKKLFQYQNEKMEASARNTLRTSERNLSTLLNQIHECRLSKLETFQKIVVEKLASLEKETQTLANMEKDAVDFWNTQLRKLNSFCSLQKQRFQSVDSALGETATTSTDSIQNTMDEHPVKNKVENNVSIAPSD
ncbi:synaptonemal complex protein 2-like [Dryobates pubescens]|uniref:synaptonemal complex protein 2-like n=1 Tax=Dryobates pubescens TaxID=118200 RepID=UPI0023BA2C7C|nr:synaptonemal complex protein 2-like [Dryobates pubescens]